MFVVHNSLSIVKRTICLIGFPLGRAASKSKESNRPSETACAFGCTFSIASCGELHIVFDRLVPCAIAHKKKKRCDSCVGAVSSVAQMKNKRFRIRAGNFKRLQNFGPAKACR